MWRHLLLALCLSALIHILVAELKEQRTKVSRSAVNKNCVNWEFGPCLFKGGAACGIGKKVGHPTDANCPLKEKLFKCKVSCDCQYKIHSGGTRVCDPVTNKRTVSLQLTRGDSTKCAQTKVVYRKCKGFYSTHGMHHQSGSKQQLLKQQHLKASD